MLISKQNPAYARKQSARRREDAGYSLLMVVFLVATSLIFASVAVPNLLTQGRREREEEAVWRGEQYERAIALYFRKFGRYPAKVDDLTKQTNGVRFLRQAYTDPLNKEDGSWRFIYVGPNGQLVGSSHSQNLLQSVLGTSAMTGTSMLGPGGTPPPPPLPPGAATGIGALGAPQAPGQQQGQQPGQQTNAALSPNPLQPGPQSLTGAVIGGSIIGVGSKVKESSLRVYKGYDSYDEWEFMFNPMQAGQIPGQPSALNQQTPTGTQTLPQPRQMPPEFPIGSAPGGPPLAGQ